MFRIKDFNLTHHPSIFVLNDVAVIHEDPRTSKVNFESDCFLGVNLDGVFQSVLIWVRRMTITRNDFKLSGVHMERMPHTVVATVGIGDFPILSSVELLALINPSHIKFLAIDHNLIIGPIESKLPHWSTRGDVICRNINEMVRQNSMA